MWYDKGEAVIDQMKRKRFPIISSIAGVCALAAGFVLPIMAIQAHTAANGPIGIIGGVDMPTLMYVASIWLNRWPLCLILLGIALLITGIFGLVFSQTIREHCTVKTSVISVALSAVGGLGLASALIWYSIVAFGKMARPDMYQPSIAVSVIAAIAFVALVAWYCKERKAHWSWKGALIDLLTCVVYSPAFFYGFSLLWAG